MSNLLFLLKQNQTYELTSHIKLQHHTLYTLCQKMWDILFDNLLSADSPWTELPGSQTGNYTVLSSYLKMFYNPNYFGPSCLSSNHIFYVAKQRMSIVGVIKWNNKNSANSCCTYVECTFTFLWDKGCHRQSNGSAYVYKLDTIAMSDTGRQSWIILDITIAMCFLIFRWRNNWYSNRYNTWYSDCGSRRRWERPIWPGAFFWYR